ncbi:MAG: hypothetical protein AAF546_11200 [Verrucomicrobiota bacterium]
MRNRLASIAFLFLAGTASATTPTLTSITQPLFYLGGADDVQIRFIEAPKIRNNAGVMFWIELFHDPTETPGSDGDMNLISIYGFKVSLSETDSEGRPTLITVDATEAVKPPRYPFAVEDVADAAVKAVRIEFPDEGLTKIEVKRAGDLSEKSNGEQAEALKP